MNTTYRENKIIGWIFLIILILAVLFLNFVKFFYHFDDQYITEVPVENSSSEAIERALNEVADIFNDEENNQLEMKASVNHNSIYVSYFGKKEIVYEFNYHNLLLSIKLNRKDTDYESFSLVFSHLVNSIQMRLDNKGDYSGMVDDFLSDNKEVLGLSQFEDEGLITYQIDISQKIVMEG